MTKSLSKQEVIAFQEELASHLEARLLDQLHLYLQLVAQWFAYNILTQTKCELTMDHGETSLVKTQQEFHLADYDSLDQFLSEYNGITYPGLEEDQDFQYDSYRQEFEQLTYTWVYQQFYAFVRDSFPECSQQEWEQVCQTAIESYQADQAIFQAAQQLSEKILPCNVKFLFELGKENAKNQWKEEQKKRHRRQWEEERKKKIVEELWRKVEAMYYLKYTEQPPPKINKIEYEHRFLPVLKDLISNGVQVETICLLGECYWFRFSESVVAMISNLQTANGNL
ncbi:hypothetical protein SAMN05444392_103242 [Seinonella peptonophila]|uniref:Uncharacterized protein n=1 Tax=Seinonella peptonophila TaxID=112248 RepID=A0A1M4WIS1_9BACL|nr:hypothetical protein [Seinonella peptonophila]SHE81149.1 hypothetical protein SAMN05444392_103242 [Seinonella peptonophila]